MRRARDMGELTQVLCRGLPEEFAGAIVAANLREDGDLVVIATSSAWASRLRYETDAMLAIARKSGIDAATCRVRVSQT